MADESAVTVSAHHPLAGISKPRPFGGTGTAQVTIREIRTLSLVLVAARAGQAKSLDHAFKQTFGTGLPGPGRSATAEDMTILWSGRDAWLLVRDGLAERALARAAQAAAGGLASVLDQTHGRCVLELSGLKAREVLAKGCPLDLHPRAFAPGDCALTQMAYTPIQLRRHPDADQFELYVPASYAEGFWDWLCRSAAEFEVEIGA